MTGLAGIGTHRLDVAHVGKMRVPRERMDSHLDTPKKVIYSGRQTVLSQSA